MRGSIVDAHQKELLTRMEALQLEKSDWERVRAAIRNANVVYADEKDDLLSILLYVAGALPALPASFGQSGRRLFWHELSPLFHPFERWNGWDRRLIDVWMHPANERQHWELFFWVGGQIDRLSAEEVFPAFAQAMAARGIEADQTMARILERWPPRFDKHRSPFLDEQGQANSLARYVLSRLPGGYGAISGQIEHVSSQIHLSELIARVDSALLDKHLTSIRPKSDADRARLLEVLLRLDPERHERLALGLAAELEDPEASLCAAEALHRAYGARQTERVSKLAAPGLDAKDHGVQLWAASLLLSALGSGAREHIQSFRTDHTPTRLRFLDLVKEHLLQEGVDLLVEGLLTAFDRKDIMGFVEYPEYVAHLAALLGDLELGAHRESIAAHFKGEKSRPVRQQVAILLGTAKRPPEKPFELPKQRYRFDRYAEEIAAAALAEARAHRKKAPREIDLVKLYHDEESYRVSALVLEGEGGTLELEFEQPPSKIPDDRDGEDKILRAVLARYGLDAARDGGLPAWGDAYRLPWSLLLCELIRAAREVRAGLAEAGFQLSPSCKAAVGDHDSDWDDMEDMAARARAAMRPLDALPNAQRAFAALCFESEAKRSWLLEPV